MESSDYDPDSICTDALQPVGGYQESGDSTGNHPQRVQCGFVPGGVFPFQWTAGRRRH